MKIINRILTMTMVLPFSLALANQTCVHWELETDSRRGEVFVSRPGPKINRQKILDTYDNGQVMREVLVDTSTRDKYVDRWRDDGSSSKSKYRVARDTKDYRRFSNGVKIWTSNGKFCAADDDVLVIGTNSADLNAAYRAGTIYDAWLSYHSGDRKLTMCDFMADSGSNSCRINFDVAFEDINPEIFREIQTAAAELDQLVPEALAAENEFEQRILAIDAAINAILTKSFNQISDQDLGNAIEQLELFSGLKRDLNTLQAQNSITVDQLTNIIADTNERIDTQLQSRGIAIADFTTSLTIDISGIIAPSPGSPVVVDNIAYYQSFAEQTVTQLKQLERAGENRAFIEQTKYWLQNSERLKDQLSSQLIASPEEWEALTTAFERVEDYVFSILTADLWFKDSPVTESQKASLRTIRNYSETHGKMIENDLRGWRQEDMNQVRHELLTMLDATANGIEASEQAGEEQDFEPLLNGLVTAVREGAVCATKVILAGDFGDFYEVVIGKDLCTGKKLTRGERLFSALGFVAANGHFWRGVGKATGIIGNTRQVVALTAKLKEQAKLLKLSDEKLQALAEKLNKTLPCGVN